MKVFWTPSAQRDRNIIFDFIEGDSPKSALEMDALFQDKSERLSETPNMGRKSQVKGLRELVVHPNYILIYKVNGDDIWILRVLHSAQKWPK